jgi:hypothetical protein
MVPGWSEIFLKRQPIGGRGVLLVGAMHSNSLDPKLDSLARQRLRKYGDGNEARDTHDGSDSSAKHRCSDSSATRTNCPFRLDERTLAGGYFLFRASLMCMSLAGVRFWAASIRGRKASTEMPSVPPEKPSM